MKTQIDRDHDVIVLGAGAAGLMCAASLAQAGLDVLVVEARNRVGGRLFTTRVGSHSVELGAEFVHGTSAEIWDLIRASGLSALEATDEHLFFSDGKLIHEPAFWEKIGETVQKIQRYLSHRKTDCSVTQALEEMKVEGHERERLLSFVEGFHAADPARMSAKSLVHEEKEAEETSGTCSFRMQGGYQPLMEKLLHQIPDWENAILFNNIAKEIRWEKGQVKIEVSTPSRDSTRTLRARCCVVTIPIGVLKTSEKSSARLEFFPPLPDKQEAVEKIEVAPVTKVIFQFKEPFWKRTRLENFSFVHSHTEEVPTWWTSRPTQSAVLTGWAGGPQAEKLSRLEERGLIQASLQSLSHLSQVPVEKIEDLLISISSHNWQTDPFAKGAYSYVSVGGYGAQKTLARPVESTLFFAGEATQFS